MITPKTALAGLLAAAALTVTACGGGGGSGSSDTAISSGTGNGSSPQGSARVIKAVAVPGLGQVLANSKGYVLYMFPPDHRGQVTCTGACAGSWPPARIAQGTTAKATGQVQQSLIATVPNPNPKGGQVVTYNGWPLYTYAADTQPRQATGQALDVNGGYWYVMRPSGKIVKTTPGQ